MTQLTTDDALREIAEFRAERNAAFEADDISWAKKRMPDAADPAVVEMAFHKARYDCTDISAAKRRESAHWLASRNLTTMNNLPVSAEGPLPA